MKFLFWIVIKHAMPSKHTFSAGTQNVCVCPSTFSYWLDREWEHGVKPLFSSASSQEVCTFCSCKVDEDFPFVSGA